mgnify:CR=1 FL=1
MKIMFFVGYANPKWNKQTWEEKGIGGSEYCVIKLSEELAQQGHTVYVVGDVEGCYINKVTYLHHDHILDNGKDISYADAIAFTKWDWVIAINYLSYMKILDECSIEFDKSLFWVHNENWHNWYKGKELTQEEQSHYLQDKRLTKIICVSEWQVPYVKKQVNKALGYTPQNDHTYIQVINNAIDPKDWDEVDDEKVPNSFIYSSATDRGLELLLDMWPQIRGGIPDASLRVCTPPYSEKWGYEIPETEGVTWLGALGPKALYSEIAKAEYWLYPSKYPETYCISALEMMMGGVKICSTNTGNLDSLLIGDDARLKGKITDVGKLEYDMMNEMIDNILRDKGTCHDDKQFHYEWYNTTMKNKKWVMKQSWEKRTMEWVDILFKPKET